MVTLNFATNFIQSDLPCEPDYPSLHLCQFSVTNSDPSPLWTPSRRLSEPPEDVRTAKQHFNDNYRIDLAQYDLTRLGPLRANNDLERVQQFIQNSRRT